MKCTGVAVRSFGSPRSVNIPRLRFRFHACSSHLFPFSSLLVGRCISLNQTRKEQASNDCLATSNTCQTKNRAEDRRKRWGPATIPRPSFTNYTEYLLTGGLSQCLLSHPTPLIFPPSRSHHSLPRVVERKLLAPPGKWRRQKKRRIKRIRRKREGSLASRLELWFRKHLRATRQMMKRLSRIGEELLQLSCGTSSVGLPWGPVVMFLSMHRGSGKDRAKFFWVMMGR